MSKRRSKKTKAGRLMKVAYASYRKGEKAVASDIFELAMQDPSAPQEFGAPSPEDLEAQLQAAVKSGDFEGASGILESMRGQSVAMDHEGGDMNLDLGGEDEDYDEDMDAALSPGDVVEPPPAPDLAPAQVASLVAVARKVAAGGHPDLARRITKAMGLP